LRNQGDFVKKRLGREQRHRTFRATTAEDAAGAAAGRGQATGRDDRRGGNRGRRGRGGSGGRARGGLRGGGVRAAAERGGGGRARGGLRGGGVRAAAERAVACAAAAAAGEWRLGRARLGIRPPARPFPFLYGVPSLPRA